MRRYLTFATVVVFVLIASQATALPKQATRPPLFGFGYVVHPASNGKPAILIVQYLVMGGPAERAGLRTGDVITMMDGKPFKDMDGLDVVLAFTKPKVGQLVTLTIVRAHQQRKIEMIPERMTDPQYAQWKTNLAILEARRAQRARQGPRP